MKKLILILVILTPLFLNAQNYKPTRSFGKDQIDLKMGIGLLPTYLMDNPKNLVPPLSLGADWFFDEKVSLGLDLGYGKSECQINDPINDEIIKGINTTLIASVRVGVHYTKMDNIDVYGGISVGFQQVNTDWETNEGVKSIPNLGLQESRNGMIHTAFIGTQYAIAPRFSLFGELGYGISIFRVGFSHRIL